VILFHFGAPLSREGFFSVGGKLMLTTFVVAIIVALIIRLSGLEEISVGDCTVKFGGSSKSPKQLKK
jgi:hypothetical protein